MQIRLALPRPDLLPLPDQQHQRTPRDEVNRRKRALGRRKARALPIRQRVETNGKRKDLPGQVDQRRDLRRLRLVAVGAVGVRERRAGLHADAGDHQADGEPDPVRALLHAHPVDDEAHGHEQRDEG